MKVALACASIVFIVLSQERNIGIQKARACGGDEVHVNMAGKIWQVDFHCFWEQLDERKKMNDTPKLVSHIP